MATTHGADARAWHAATRLAESTIAPALIAVSLALTLLAPLWLLLLAPIVLGIPHVIGDFRCLVGRGSSAREPRVLAAVAAPLTLMTLLRAAALAGAEPWPRVDIACGIAAVCAGLWGARTRIRARVAAVASALLVGSLACMHASAATLVLAHAHNLLAFCVYFAWARRRSEARLSLVAYGVALGCLMLVPLPLEAEDSAAGLSLSRLAEQFAPGLSASWAQRVVLVFAFTQAVHYAVWVWLAPRDRAATSRIGSATGEAWIAAIAIAAVPLLALANPLGVRSAYLSLVAFHAWFELAVLASWWRGAPA
ncbi:MAG: hypothetical protein IT454_12225 [Planctomycetes bacterium]|nr:hypothetical protein [Planctomycetota bacterium]